MFYLVRFRFRNCLLMKSGRHRRNSSIILNILIYQDIFRIQIQCYLLNHKDINVANSRMKGKSDSHRSLATESVDFYLTIYRSLFSIENVSHGLVLLFSKNVYSLLNCIYVYHHYLLI